MNDQQTATETATSSCPVLPWGTDPPPPLRGQLRTASNINQMVTGWFGAVCMKWTLDQGGDQQWDLRYSLQLITRGDIRYSLQLITQGDIRYSLQLITQGDIRYSLQLITQGDIRYSLQLTTQWDIRYSLQLTTQWDIRYSLQLTTPPARRILGPTSPGTGQGSSGPWRCLGDESRFVHPAGLRRRPGNSRLETCSVKPLSYDGPGGMYGIGSEDGSRPGTFYVNLMRPNDTSTFSMVSLTLHETVPGHHLQGIYQLAAQLPSFQKHMNYEDYFAIPYHFPFYTAYTEGWALYAEYLGEEMGVYVNDYERMGRYGDEIFRACRLVVDTGLHYFGWSRAKAIQYLNEHTPLPQAAVEIEVDRYLTWPGQACAYKIGELKIKELRQRATTALGDQFDVRDFHSLLLNNGPVPLSVMEKIVDDYIHHIHSGGSPIG